MLCLIHVYWRPLAVPSHAYFDDGQRVVAENIHHLDCDLAPPARAFVEDALQFQGAVFLGPESPATLTRNTWLLSPEYAHIRANFCYKVSFYYKIGPLSAVRGFKYMLVVYL